MIKSCVICKKRIIFIDINDLINKSCYSKIYINHKRSFDAYFCDNHSELQKLKFINGGYKNQLELKGRCCGI